MLGSLIVSYFVFRQLGHYTRLGSKLVLLQATRVLLLQTELFQTNRLFALSMREQQTHVHALFTVWWLDSIP